MHWIYLILPLAGALIGYVTNYLAIKMLFHPRQPKRLLFFTVQGIFPKKQREFGARLGQLVAGELLSIDEITIHLKEYIASQEFLDRLEERVKYLIVEKLTKEFPMFSMILNDEVLNKLTKVFREDLCDLVSNLIEHLSQRLEQDVKIERLVEEKVAGFSVERLEQIVFSVMRQELRFIEIIGAVLGFFIGVLQLLLVLTLP